MNVFSLGRTKPSAYRGDQYEGSLCFIQKMRAPAWEEASKRHMKDGIAVTLVF